MDIDLVKLGRLIEKCQDAGVLSIKLPAGVEVVFSGQKKTEEEKIDLTTHPLDQKYSDLLKGPVITGEELEKEVSLVSSVLDFEEEMLHITDPAEWQRRQLSESEDNFIAVGGDEDMELSDAHG